MHSIVQSKLYMLNVKVMGFVGDSTPPSSHHRSTEPSLTGKIYCSSDIIDYGMPHRLLIKNRLDVPIMFIHR